MTQDKRPGQDETRSQASPSDEPWDGPTGGAPGFGHPQGPHHYPSGRPHHRPPVPGHHTHRGHPPHGPAHRNGLSGDGFSGRAEEVLSRILPSGVVNWALRAASFGPPEIVAIFKAQVATIEHALAAAEASGADPLWFTHQDLQTSDETCKAMASVMTDEEARICLHNLFLGPEEVQALGFLSLVVLRAAFATGVGAADNVDS